MREGEERIVLYERDEMLKQIEALQQENEQLQVQNAVMRGALKQAREAMEQFGDYYAGKQTALTLHKCNKCGKLNLNDAPICLDCVAIDINKALVAIDKIGGGEDER